MWIRVLTLSIAIVGVIFVSTISAASWTRYFNVRFSYGVDIPPGFSEVLEADNSDGGRSRSADGAAELKVWGAYLPDGDFKSDVAERIQSDAGDGWTISYDRRAAGHASWSGTRGSQILYMRAVKGCDSSAAYFQLIYDRSSMKAYDKIVERLVKSLRAC